MSTAFDATAWAEQLLQVGLAVRRRVIEVMRPGCYELARPVAHQGGDMIYELDRRVEPVIEQAVQSWPVECKPLLLVAEGISASGCKRFGDAACSPRFRVIVDPIDGTRSLMYDKRPAWFTAAVAPDMGETTTLADIIAAVIVELPTSKQGWADSFVAVKNGGARARRSNLLGTVVHDMTIRPSSASSLVDGFAQVSNFFPGTKMLASDLMERIVASTIGQVRAGRADVFEDQYISSVGQMVELMVGHDRFCCDLRPLFYQALDTNLAARQHGLTCHPYDLAGCLVAQEAGVILTDGFGRPLRFPLGVDHAAHWCGYANQSLRELIEPVINQWLAEHNITSM